jgi:hypothetical protein
MGCGRALSEAWVDLSREFSVLGSSSRQDIQGLFAKFGIVWYKAR